MDPTRAREIQAQGGRSVPSMSRTFCSQAGLAAMAGQQSAKSRPPQTHCKRGHVLAGENIRIYGGTRHCMVCRKMKTREAR